MIAFARERPARPQRQPRRSEWGIPVPDDPAHVIYVWFDALTNYLTAVGFGRRPGAFGTLVAGGRALDGQGDHAVPHASIWPAMLMAAGLAVPKRVIGHGWWLTERGEKMSKSLGNVVEPQDATSDGSASMRSALLRDARDGRRAGWQFHVTSRS